ncbi:hypothetical protein [Yoonia sp.]|uniref:hypothetical protein n=1 Tax=Yoonia sp. TaxID=2212373 RepID=UPI0025D1F82E|nr:hypothetical protein [Yoonia sp.]
MKTIMLAALVAFGPATAAMACPDYSITPSESYRTSGPELYEPRTFNVVAGGDNYVWNCRHIRPGTDTGAGYFPSAPDFSFELSKMSRYQLVVSLESECDAALLINTASTNWFYDDDDNGNLDPRIVLTRPLDGRIDIWVGTYDGEYCDAQLTMETFDR